MDSTTKDAAYYAQLIRNGGSALDIALLVGQGVRNTVRDWHPKCETCGNWKDAECPYFDWADAPADHYCKDHTNLNQQTP